MIAIRSDKKIFDLTYDTSTKIDILISEGFPFITWNNNYYSTEKDKVYSLNNYCWEIKKHNSYGYNLMDSRGELRTIIWGEFSDAILFENYIIYDKFCKKQKSIENLQKKFNLSEKDIYEIHDTMTRICNDNFSIALRRYSNI